APGSGGDHDLRFHWHGHRGRGGRGGGFRACARLGGGAARRPWGVSAARGGREREGGGGGEGNGCLSAALRARSDGFGEMKQTLCEMVRIPGVSAPGFPAAEVRRSAAAFAAVLRRIGLENVRVLQIPGVHPYVYGDWLHRPEAPTLLLYGH